MKKIILNLSMLMWTGSMRAQELPKVEPLGGFSYFSTILGAGLDVAVRKQLAIRALQADCIHVFRSGHGSIFGSNDSINIGRIS
jgi:hypothetical protein